ncbi:14255_t:CDS:2, partial [Dentiscutata erythropus]
PSWEQTKLPETTRNLQLNVEVERTRGQDLHYNTPALDRALQEEKDEHFSTAQDTMSILETTIEATMHSGKIPMAENEIKFLPENLYLNTNKQIDAAYTQNQSGSSEMDTEPTESEASEQSHKDDNIETKLIEDNKCLVEKGKWSEDTKPKMKLSLNFLQNYDMLQASAHNNTCLVYYCLKFANIEHELTFEEVRRKMEEIETDMKVDLPKFPEGIPQKGHNILPFELLITDRRLTKHLYKL